MDKNLSADIIRVRYEICALIERLEVEGDCSTSSYLWRARGEMDGAFGLRSYKESIPDEQEG